jgi:putative ATPase
VAQAAHVEGRRGADVDFVNAVSQRAGRRFDKGGENYYDQISALHKSVRGSDPDASLYWLVRMLDGGVDPRYLARRMIRMASEDIGLADPARARSRDQRGRHLRAPGHARGRAGTRRVRDLPRGGRQVERGVCGLQRGEGLRAGGRHAPRAAAHPQRADEAHEEPRLRQGLSIRPRRDEGYAAGENYFPDGMQRPDWYRPTDRGLEAKIRERIEHLRALDAARRKERRSEAIRTVLRRPGRSFRPGVGRAERGATRSGFPRRNPRLPARRRRIR